MFDLIAFLGESNPFVSFLKQAQERGASITASYGEIDFNGIFGQSSATGVSSPYGGAGFDMEFESDCAEEDDAYWHAELCISPGVGPDDSLVIFLNDASGNPLHGGYFVFLGLSLVIENGMTECPIVHLRDNLSRTDVFVQHEGGLCVPGHFRI